MSLNAIYITDRFVRITQAIKEKATSFKEFELDISSLKKEDLPIQLAKFLKEKNITPDNLTLIIPRSQATIRYLTFPSVDEKEINRMVEYEVDNLFPYKKEELVIDSAVIEKRADGYSQVLVAAIKKADIDNQLLLLKQAGLVPDSIGLSSISIFNQFIQSFDYAQDKRKKTPVNYLLVNLEDNLLDIIIVCNGNLIFSRGVNLKQQEERIRLINETRNIISIHETKGISVEKLILTGRGINLNELAVSFEQAFGMKVEINQADCVTRGIMVPSTAKSLDIELLPEESKIHKLKDRIRKSVLYFIVLILLNASLIGNITFLNMKKRQGYLHLLQSEIKKIESEALSLEQKLNRIEILNSYLISGRMYLALLSELYQIAPDGVMLNALDISGKSPSGILVLIGEAKDSQRVLRFTTLMKNSTLINKADINYIKKRRARSGEVVDFEIRAAF